MGFTSAAFCLFAILVVLVYYLLPKRFQWIMLLVASIGFYASYGLERLPFILASSLIAYFAAKKMGKIKKTVEDESEAKKKCRSTLILALAGLIALLLYAKIGTWVMQTVGAALKLDGAETAKGIVALGISYYTFSLISYLADVYWDLDEAETNYLRLLAFTIYFPKILQGPISRHSALAPQLREEHRFNYQSFCFGLQRMAWGYFKKMIIADRLVIFVNTVFGNIAGETGAHLLLASVFATVQLYCDFSGCMDIACGFSESLGLKLEENFARPFFSKNAAEVWRRWHITLSMWFRDYVYMPLGRSKRLSRVSKKMRERFGARAGRAVATVIPVFAVWLLTGLWHGVTWVYVVWGLYWGVLVGSSMVFAPEYKKLAERFHIDAESGSWRLIQMIRTFFLFVLSQILTVPGSLGLSWLIIKKIFTEFQIGSLFGGALYYLGLSRKSFLIGLLAIVVVWIVDTIEERDSVRERIAKTNIVFRWIAYYALIFSILIFGIYGQGYDAASFIYMQF